MVIPSKLNGKRGTCSMPSTLTAEDFVSEEYVPGSLVWAKCTTYPWWPAMVEDDPDEEEYHRTVAEDKEEYHVVFLTDKPQCVRRAWIAAKYLLEYVNPPKRNHVKKNWARALQLSKEIADIALPMSLSERLKKFSFAQLASRKFPIHRKDGKTSKILVKKNERGRTVSAITNKRRRHASADVETMNGAATKVPKIGFTAEDAASVSNTTVPEIGRNVASSTSVPEVSHTIEICAHSSPPQTGAVNAASNEIVTGVQTSSLPSMNGASEDPNYEDIDMDAFEKELELYTDDELPSSPESKDSLPEFLRNKKLDELFSDCMSESDSLGSVDDVALPYYRECDSDPEQSPQEEPIREKFVLTSEEDIWDINNPNLKKTHVWQKDFH